MLVTGKGLETTPRQGSHSRRCGTGSRPRDIPSTGLLLGVSIDAISRLSRGEVTTNEDCEFVSSARRQLDLFTSQGTKVDEGMIMAEGASRPLLERPSLDASVVCRSFPTGFFPMLCHHPAYAHAHHVLKVPSHRSRQIGGIPALPLPSSKHPVMLSYGPWVVGRTSSYAIDATRIRERPFSGGLRAPRRGKGGAMDSGPSLRPHGELLCAEEAQMPSAVPAHIELSCIERGRSIYTGRGFPP